jgi:hypothetical protein
MEVENEWTYSGAANLTVQGVAQAIIDLDPNMPNYVRTVQAKIKRLIHAEKFSLCHRIGLAGRDTPDFGMKFVALKEQTHKEMMQKPDEEIITWKV